MIETSFNQRKQDYLSSLNRLKEKAIAETSIWPSLMTDSNGIKLGKKATSLKKRQERWSTDWGTSFPHLLELTERENNLNPKALITYKRPIATGQLLANNKYLALSKAIEHVKGLSGPCGYCALCGNYGKQNRSVVPSATCFRNNEQNFCVSSAEYWCASVQRSVDVF